MTFALLWISGTNERYPFYGITGFQSMAMLTLFLWFSRFKIDFLRHALSENKNLSSFFFSSYFYVGFDSGMH